MSWSVEEERKRIKEAQRQGIAIARKNGVYKGTEKKYKTEHKGVMYAYKLYKEDQMTMNEITETVGISRSTLYRRFKEIEASQKDDLVKKS